MEQIWESEQIDSVNGNPVFRRIMQNFIADFHIHENSEEMFIVESGVLFIDFGDRSIRLTSGESFAVKSGIKHRARAVEKVALWVIGGQNI
ncbi:MAG: cupin domain-containing protein [Pseudomonadales bacterium]|nr:cupin domain-containing protein [Pseudomonadales bacterium]